MSERAGIATGALYFLVASGLTLIWGALGVGGFKMKVHKAALKSLFRSNTLVLDAEQILEIARAIA
mgnify:CR=1 FL=1